jgi:hypothetical protein
MSRQARSAIDEAMTASAGPSFARGYRGACTPAYSPVLEARIRRAQSDSDDSADPDELLYLRLPISPRPANASMRCANPHRSLGRRHRHSRGVKE